MMMQIYADVTNREIFIGASDQSPALGSAMFGAVAAGREKGGYDTIFEAAKAWDAWRREPTGRTRNMRQLMKSCIMNLRSCTTISGGEATM